MDSPAPAIASDAAPPRTVDPQLVYLDPFLIDRLRLDAGFSRKQLAGEAKVAFNTVRELFNGGGVQPATARVVSGALGRKVVDLLAPWDPRYVAPAEATGPAGGSAEWEAVGYLDQGRLAPNGLYYIVSRMRHRHIAARQGRGKFYHLSWLTPSLREQKLHQLARHAEVCARVGQHANIVVNIGSLPVGNNGGWDGWWVIDQWVGERTLADHLHSEPWPRDRLPRLLLEVAQGLDALHQAGIVFRELAPSRVLIAEQNGKFERAVLTDFELAKLLDDSPSVSSEWPEDPFRAPELDGGNAVPVDQYPRADLYSFGCLAAAAVSGQTPAAGTAAEILQHADLPKRLARLVGDCVHPVPTKRPEGMTPLLKELVRWEKA